MKNRTSSGMHRSYHLFSHSKLSFGKAYNFSLTFPKGFVQIYYKPEEGHQYLPTQKRLDSDFR